MEGAPKSSGLVIVCYPDPILRQVAEPLLEIDPEIAALARAMLVLMKESKGVGLAAPQVARGIRLFVSNTTGKPEDDRVFVNPEILRSHAPKEEREEGCLSLPGIKGKIVRPARISYRSFDLDGNESMGDLDGLAGRVFQHELDHLDGILITDKMGPAERHQAERLLKDLVREYGRSRCACGADHDPSRPHAHGPPARSRP